MMLKTHLYPCDPQMTYDPMIVAWDMLGLIGDYCGKIQSNSDKVRQSYVIKTKMKQNDFF